MSSKKATKASPVKTKKRSSRKKVARTSSTGKSRRNSMVAKKKTARKKSATKKVAARKRTAKKTTKKASVSRKKSASAGKHTPGNTNSLSWMSAQAASALKAVKASQAEKGQTILARTRKQTAREIIDDDSLIEIAERMPVDDEGLIAFSAEQPQEEPAAQEPEPVVEETVTGPETSTESTPEAETELETAEPPAVPAEQTQPATAPPPPPPAAKHRPIFLPALAAGILVVLLAYMYWPDRDNGVVAENSPAVATGEATLTGTETPPVVTVRDAEPAPEPVTPNDVWTPAGITRTWEPAAPPPTTSIAPASEAAPMPEPEPEPVTAAPVDTPSPQPPAPARRDYREPAYGGYPQQRPAYPHYYYR